VFLNIRPDFTPHLTTTNQTPTPQDDYAFDLELHTTITTPYSTHLLTTPHTNQTPTPQDNHVFPNIASNHTSPPHHINTTTTGELRVRP
jgi:hypothetical protein